MAKEEPVSQITTEMLDEVEASSMARGGDGAFMITAKCHDGAPVFLTHKGGTHQLAIVCAWCGRLQANIQVAQALIVRASCLPPQV